MGSTKNMGTKDETTTSSKKKGRPPTKWKETVVEMSKGLYGLCDTDNGLYEALQIHLFNKAFIEKTPITKVDFNGSLKSNEMDGTQVQKFFSKNGLVLLTQNVETPAPERLDPTNIRKTNVVSHSVFYDNKNIVSINHFPAGYHDGEEYADDPDEIQILVHSANSHGYRIAAEFMAEFTQTPEVRRKKGCIHVLMENHGSFQFVQAGFSSAPFVSENYLEPVASGFPVVMKALTDEDPMGRLTILSGKTGSGKTYFIRGLVDALDGGFFVFVTTTMIKTLVGPELIKAFLAHKNDIGGGSEPLILIVEDADSCMKRDAESMNALSSLLNISDGLLAECLDIRVIATTNADTPEIADALLRSGRLVKHLKFEAFSAGHADAVYRRLTGGKSLASHERTGEILLADVYSLWRKNHPQPIEDTPKKPVLREGQYDIRARRKARKVLGD